MIRARLFGAELRVCFSFAVFNCLLLLLAGDAAPAFYAACAVHELGHVIVLRAAGERLRRVEFRGTGMLLIPERDPLRKAAPGVAALAAGPAANLLLWAGLRLFCGGGPAASANLALGLYNLAPYDSLDGGAIFDLLVCGSLRERACREALFFAKLVSAFALAAGAFFHPELIPFAAAAAALLIGETRR